MIPTNSTPGRSWYHLIQKKRPKYIIYLFNIRYLAGCFEKYIVFKGDRANPCWGSSANYRAVELEGNQGRRWNDSNSSRDELEGYMVIQEASVVHSSGELEINQLIPGWVGRHLCTVQNWGYVLFCEIWGEYSIHSSSANVHRIGSSVRGWVVNPTSADTDAIITS